MTNKQMYFPYRKSDFQRILSICTQNESHKNNSRISVLFHTFQIEKILRNKKVMIFFYATILMHSTKTQSQPAMGNFHLDSRPRATTYRTAQVNKLKQSSAYFTWFGQFLVLVLVIQSTHTISERSAGISEQFGLLPLLTQQTSLK